MNKSLHTVTIPVRDYEYLMKQSDSYNSLLTDLKRAIIKSDSNNELLLFASNIRDIYEIYPGIKADTDIVRVI